MEGRMAERADDLRDVRDRLLRLLTGGDRVNLADLPEDSVVLAERLTPSDTAQLDPETVAGFATITGGRTSHAAIFARSLALPAVVGLGEGLTDVAEGTEVVVDGDAGELLVEPDDAEREAARAEEGADVIPESVATSDGREIEVAANVGRPEELEPAAAGAPTASGSTAPSSSSSTASPRPRRTSSTRPFGTRSTPSPTAA